MIRISFLAYVFCFFSCSEGSSESGLEIVNNSIQKHGGHQAFQELESVSFNKTTRLFKEDGSLESETIQKQSFQLQPDYFLRIKWELDSVNYEIAHNRKTTLKKVNDSVVKDSIEIQKALKMALSAEYVFFQPFKLLEKDAQLNYKGNQMIRDSIETRVVSVGYKSDTMVSDSWKYYFDSEYCLIAASVAHNKRTSLIENLEFQRYKGILFNKHRQSYFVDSLLQKKYLRAEYFYDIIETRQ